jgi:hypothetical protein
LKGGKPHSEGARNERIFSQHRNSTCRFRADSRFGLREQALARGDRLAAMTASDDRFTEAAFESYKQFHGISERRLGDLKLTELSEVLRQAQMLKAKAQEANQ